MGTIVIQKPNASRTTKRAVEPPTLADVQGWVEGYVELVWRGRSASGELVQFFANEDGLSMELPPNPEGNVLFAELFGELPTQIFVGAVVALVGEDVQWT